MSPLPPVGLVVLGHCQQAASHADISQLPGSQPPVSAVVVSGSVAVSASAAVAVEDELVGDVELDAAPPLDVPDVPDESEDDGTPGCE